MATIKVLIRTEKTKKNGEAPLYIRLTQDRKSKYISLGFGLLPRQWDADKQRVRKSHPNAPRLNALIAEKRAEVEGLALEVARGQKKITRKRVKVVLQHGSDESFFDYAQEFLDKLAREGRHGTFRNYRSSLNCFRTWLADQRMKELSFQRLDANLASGYREYLEKERDNKPATVFVKFAALKSIISSARNAGVVSDDYNPLSRIKVNQKKARKVIPTREEMQAIQVAELPSGSKMEQVRDLYLFCANMAGLRFSDALTLRWAQVEGEWLRWNTIKTGKQRLVYIPQGARDILDRYRNDESQGSDFVFPFLQGHELVDAATMNKLCNIRNMNANASLKRICKRAGLSRNFTFHTSRHHCATDSLRRGIRVEVLQHLLTHSSRDQTMEYAQIVNGDMDEAMRAYEMAKQG
ncbi:MAG: site-specific integrase [Bacteroidota bacterium]